MTTESPAATLRRAAEYLRRLAVAIEPDMVFLRGVPWHTETNFETGLATTVLQGGAKPADHVQPVRRIAEATAPELAAFIAAMHPGVATAPARWLDEAVADAGLIGASPWALVAARQILGEA